MEDEHVLEDQFGGISHQAFFGVYDGHGGQTAAGFCKNRLHLVFDENMKGLSDEDLIDRDKMSAVALNSYKQTDAEMKPSIPAAGACVVTCIIRTVSDHRYLYVANAGDSRAILSRGGQALCLSVDHKASNKEEADRIIAAGGFIKDNRVNGLIAISRSLGDHYMKAYIPSEPYTTCVELEPTDTILILACDGVWDVLPIQMVVDLVVAETNPLQMAKKILQHAIKERSTDNITVLVVLL